MNTLDAQHAKQIELALAEQAQRLLKESLADNATLAGCWWNVISKEISVSEIAATQNTKRTTRETLTQTAEAWERAQYLFFALLPAHLDALRETVAAQLEQEYKGIVADDVASQIRNIDRADLLKYQ